MLYEYYVVELVSVDAFALPNLLLFVASSAIHLPDSIRAPINF